MTGPARSLGPVLHQAADDAERMAHDLSGVLPRLRTVTTEVRSLIGGTAGKEDTTMTERLDTAARLIDTAVTELRKAAVYARAAGTTPS